MRELINKFRIYQEKLNKSGNTIDSYVKEVERFIKQYDIESIEDLKILQDKHFVMETWLTNVTEKYAPNTVNRIKASLSVFVAFLITEDILDMNRIKLIEDVKVDTKKIEVYTTDEEQDILKYIDLKIKNKQFKRKCDKQVYKMQRCILEMMMFSALRVSEVRKLKLEDIDLVNKKMDIRGKGFNGNVSRVLSIKDDFLKTLNEYLEIRNSIEIKEGEREYLFISPLTKTKATENSIRKFLKNVLSELEMDGCCHKIRHSRISELIEKKANVKQVSLFAGHANEKITEKIYIHPMEESMKELANM